MRRALPILLLACACSSPPKPDPAPPPAPDPIPEIGDPDPVVEVADPPDPVEPSAPCAGPSPGEGYECVQDCGPPVARQGDPEPGHSWLSAEQAARRRQYGCPICLAPDTRIATPRGDVAIAELAEGDVIWSVDGQGRRIAARVRYAASTPAPPDHRLLRITLADGRRVRASPGHPTADGRTVAELSIGDAVSDSRIARIEVTALAGDATLDIVPDSPTRSYWADGVLLTSSLSADR